MSSFKTPWSGDVGVHQVFSPFKSMFQAIGNPIGLNIFMGRTSKPELEQEIVEKVGSYGHQLGRISDALEVLLRHVSISDPTEEETAMLYLFKQQVDAVNTIKGIKPSNTANAVAHKPATRNKKKRAPENP